MTIPVLLLIDAIIAVLLVYMVARIFLEGRRQRALAIHEDEKEEQALGEEE